MRLRALPPIAALLGAALLGGCDVLTTLLSRAIQASPSPGPASPPPTPFPTPSPPTEVREAVLAQLQVSNYLPLFSSRLINDGIGIFAGAQSTTATGARRWGRDYKAVSATLDDQAAVYLAEPAGDRHALVVFTRVQPGTWLGDFAWRKALVRKGFQEGFHREALFGQYGATWRLTEISVAIQKPATYSVDIADVTLSTAAGSAFYRTGPNPENRLVRLERLAAGLPGEALDIVVHTNVEKVAVFAYLGGTRRQALTPLGHDGTGWRFSGEVAFPDVPDLGQIGIDAISRATLEDTSAGYDATLWGVPVKRIGGAL